MGRTGRRVALALLLAGCGGGAEESAPVVDAPGATAVPSDSATGALVRAAMAGSAADVVGLLLALDTADLRFSPAWEEALRQAFCMERDTGCRGDEAELEDIVVVDGYQVAGLAETADSAVFSVLHDAVATVWPGGIGEAAGTQPVTITLRRSRDGWRISSVRPPLAAHLSRESLLRRYTGVQPDSVMLARWLRDH